MTLKSDEVRDIAHLARLHIADDRVEQYAGEMSSFLTLAEQMNQIDTTGVKPLANPHDATQRLREDSVTEDNNREKFQSIAPDVDSGLYRVPRVIE